MAVQSTQGGAKHRNTVLWGARQGDAILTDIVKVSGGEGGGGGGRENGGIL